LALPAKHASAQITGTANDLFKAAQAILNQILADVSGKRTAAEFQKARDEHFPQYTMVMMAIGNVIRVVVPPAVIDRLAWESFSEMEADFRDGGAAAFGKDISDQAIFTVWTLRKIHDLATRIQRSGDAIQNSDPELLKGFVNNVLYSRFHLDCLKASLRSERAIYPEVLESISEGLRALVNAYAYIRRATDVVRSSANEEPIHIDFDEEEQELVALSMKDLASDAIL
jgi:hypothetical protein